MPTSRRDILMRVPTCVVVAALVVLAACSGDSAPTSTGPGADGSSPDAGVPGGPLVVPAVDIPTGELGIPGLYVPLNVSIMESGPSGAQLATALSCPQLIDVMAAGQWETISRMEATPDQTFLATLAYGFTASAILGWGDDRLFVRGAGPSIVIDDPVGEVPDEDYCLLRIDRVVAGEVVVTGSVPFAETAFAYPVKCVVLDERTEVNMAYSLGSDEWLQLKFVLRTTAAGTHEVAGGSFEAGIGVLSKPPWELIAETMAGALEDLVPTLILEPSGEVVGTATIDAESFSGTVTFDALVSESSGEPIALTAPWSCGGMGRP